MNAVRALRFTPNLAARSPASRRCFVSAYGPRMKVATNYKGVTTSTLRNFIPMTAGFGAATVVALLLFMEEVPPVRKDIFQRIPIIGSYWIREVPPEDNPF